MSETNRRILLAERPTGMPTADSFKMVEEGVPAPGPGQVLVRTLYLSLDPYMRGRMNAAKSYTAPVEIGDVMVGGVVGRIEASNADGWAEGDIVEGTLGWQDYAAADPASLRKVDPDLAPVSTAVGVLGMPGLTAYFALLDLGRPKEGDTVLVSAASGAVGAVVGQIAKIKGCRAVGIAGSDEKIDYITDELGFDAGINYKTADLNEALHRACPDGVDVYFDNVGGTTSWTAFEHLAMNARIVICGQMSQYNLTEPEIGPRNLRFMLVNRAVMSGFLVFDYLDRYDEARKELAGWLQEGRLQFKEDVTEGLENTVDGFLRLMAGKNFGKAVVHVAS